MWNGADWSLDPCVPPRSSEQRYFPMHSTGVKPESGISQCRGHGSIRAHTQSSESKQSSKLFRDNCVYPDWSEGSFPSPQSQRERRRIDRRKQIVDKGCLEENTSLLHAQYCAINSVYKKQVDVSETRNAAFALVTVHDTSHNMYLLWFIEVK